jgi:hypothetical protein
MHRDRFSTFLYTIYLTSILTLSGMQSIARAENEDFSSAPKADAPSATPGTKTKGESEPAIIRPAASTANQPAENTNASDAASFSSAPNSDVGPSAGVFHPSEETESVASPYTNQLSEKFKGKRIGVLLPLDYTSLYVSQAAGKSLTRAISRYGSPQVTFVDDFIESLTLEEFRRIVIRHNIDILIIAVIKPYNADVFLFDKRTPYDLYTSNQSVAKESVDHLTPEVVLKYVDATLASTLQGYILDQRYELPRAVSQESVDRNVQRLVATDALLTTVNKELASKFYFSVATGGAIGIAGAAGQSALDAFDIVTLEGGWRLNKTWYIEASLDMFSYNTLGISAKYVTTNNLEVPYRLEFGFGPAIGIDQSTIAFDPDIPPGAGAQFLTGSATVLFPTMDIYLKIETKLYVALGGGAKTFFTVTPGLTLFF